MKPSAEERMRAFLMANTCVFIQSGKAAPSPLNLPAFNRPQFDVALTNLIEQAYADGRASRDAEIEEAVRVEREECVTIALRLWRSTKLDCAHAIAEAIRARAASAKKEGG